MELGCILEKRGELFIIIIQNIMCLSVPCGSKVVLIVFLNDCLLIIPEFENNILSKVLEEYENHFENRIYGDELHYR